MHQLGKYLIVTGVFILIVGLVLYFAGNKMSWLGNLPGDIKIKRDHFTLYVPITTMLIISVFFSLLLWIISKIK